MTLNYLKRRHIRLYTIIIVMMATLCATAQNESERTYTTGHPLVYEDAWDLWPYCYLNEYGEPEGFNVDLIKLLMKKLDIPYIIKLKARHEVLEDMKERRADLTLGMKARFHNDYGHYGNSIVQLFTHSLLSPKNKPVEVRLFSDLSHNKVIVHRKSFSHHLMTEKGWGDNAIPCDDMKEAVQDLCSSLDGQILWNTASLKWLMRMYHTDDLQLTPVNMPYGEYCFIANDSLLLDKLDKMHNKLSADGELEPIQNKWFYPEMVDSGIPSWIWYLTGFTVFCLLVLIYYNLSINIRERLINRTTQRRNNRLSLVLQTCHIKIWLYDVASNTFILTDRNGKPQRHFTSLEVSLYFKPADFERVCEAIRQITDMETKSVTLEINSNRNEDGIDGMGVRLLTLSVLRYEQGKPSVILGTINDITEERRRQQDIKERLVKYQSICNTAMVDMVFYDAEGYVTGINDRCCITLNRNREQFLKDHVNVRDLFAQTDIDVSDLNLPLTTLLLNKEARLEKLESRKEKDVMYYEMQLVPVYDKNHNLIGAYGTGRDVSEIARSYHKLQKSIRNMQKANDRITKYINNINYVLDFSGTRQVSYSPEKHTLTVFKNQNIVQLSLTQSRCMTLIDDSCRKKAMRALSSMDNLTTHPVNIEVKTILRRKGMPVYLSFSFLPILDEKGVVTSYMGFCRDDSEIRATEQLLEKESARAQEVENLKNSFLRNMSYEIRTPLNSVVGFAELFEMPHTPEDEELFIAQIKGNSAHLLNLINDILFLSRLDAHMIEIKKQPTDFAMTFEGHCQIGWENHKKEGVRYITENHYDKLVVDIDDTNTGRIIEQIISNAAMFTQTGTVLGRYDYINGNLMIAIEDTGIGMPEKTLDHIFERFVSGSYKETTGLGLPICKELAEQMGGTLSINSEEGKGTSVWISIPCTALEIQRKKDI